MTAEIVARLEASFALDDAHQLADVEGSEELQAMLADIDNLKARIVRSYRERRGR
jgi:hypothetical protein